MGKNLKSLILLAILFLQSCATPSLDTPSSAQPLRGSRISFIITPTHPTIPPEIVQQRLTDAVSELSTYTTRELSPTRHDGSTLCFINFTRQFISYVPDPYIGYATVRPCQVWLRDDRIIGDRFLFDMLRHELGHILLGGYHSSNPRSVMYQGITEGGTYVFTQEDIRQFNE